MKQQGKTIKEIVLPCYLPLPTHGKTISVIVLPRPLLSCLVWLPRQSSRLSCRMACMTILKIVLLCPSLSYRALRLSYRLELSYQAIDNLPDCLTLCFSARQSAKLSLQALHCLVLSCLALFLGFAYKYGLPPLFVSV